MTNLSAKGLKWQKKEINLDIKNQIEKTYQIDNLLSEILSSKFSNISDVKNFISPLIKHNMKYSPSILNGMEKAVNHVIDAIIKKKKIAIFGDYDVDGATSSAIFINYFYELGIDLISYIPDRIIEGYGPNKNAFLSLKKLNIDLVITVDCGALTYDEIDYANEIGLSVIVIDHHLATGKKPNAVSVINPNHSDEKGQYKYLAAVGVSFLFLTYLQKKLLEKEILNNENKPNLLNFLDIVALGTVCDVVPIIDLNRSFVVSGLKLIRNGNNIGIKALLDVIKLDPKKISTYHLGFMIGPRINAGGRVGESSLGTKLLTSKNLEEAYKISLELDKFNQERKTIEKITIENSIKEIDNKNLMNNAVIIVSDTNFHVGVIGIVASRIKEKYNRPSIIISFDNDNIGKASCRSIKNVDLGDAIKKAKEKNLIINGGGHKMAAGFSLKKENLKSFSNFIIKFLEDSVNLTLAKNNLKYQKKFPISALNINLYNKLKTLEPYGLLNKEPRFVINNCHIIKLMIIGEKHLKLILTENINGVYGKNIESVIWYGVNNDLGKYIEKHSQKKKFSFLGKIRINEWNNRIRIQFDIEDIVLCEETTAIVL